MEVQIIDVIEDARNEFKVKVTDKLENEVISFLNTNGGNIYNCAGIDVHKKVIVVTIAKTDSNNITEYQTKSFPTFTEDLIKCREWLVSNNTLDVCMESTGKYWILVFNILETKCNCVITHPKNVRSIPGKKTDKKDSKWIADMFKHGLVEPSFMPPNDIRQLRDLMRYRNKLVNMRTSEKNRFQNSLTVSNVQIASVVTDVFGKTSQPILKLMLDNPNLTIDDITPLLRKNLKSSPEDILKSSNGTFDDSQVSKMSVVLKHYDYINECIDSIEEQVLKLIVKYTDELNLLLTIPSINDTSAIFIIAEIGTNMNAFIDGIFSFVSKNNCKKIKKRKTDEGKMANFKKLYV